MLRAKNEWHFYCFIAHEPNIPRTPTSLAHGTASKAESRRRPLASSLPRAASLRGRSNAKDSNIFDQALNPNVPYRMQ